MTTPPTDLRTQSAPSQGQPTPTRPAGADQYQQFQADLDKARNGTRSQANSQIRDLNRFKDALKPPTKLKYYILGTTTFILDFATVIEDAVGGDFTVIVYIIKILIKAFAFAGYYYVMHKDSQYATLLGRMEDDIKSKINHLQQRTQNLKTRAKDAQARRDARASANRPTPNVPGSIRQGRPNPSSRSLAQSRAGGSKPITQTNLLSKTKSLISNPKDTLLYWAIDLVPYADLFPWETFAIYKLYRTTYKNYEAILSLTNQEYNQAINNFQLAEQNFAQSQEEAED